MLEAIVRLDSTQQPIAETYRRVAAEAEHLGLTRPSYQRIRELVHEARSIRRTQRRPTAEDVFWAITAPWAGRQDVIRRLEMFGIAPYS